MAASVNKQGHGTRECASRSSQMSLQVTMRPFLEAPSGGKTRWAPCPGGQAGPGRGQQRPLSTSALLRNLSCVSQECSSDKGWSRMQALNQSYPRTAGIFIVRQARTGMLPRRLSQKPEHHGDTECRDQTAEECGQGAFSRVPLTWTCKQPLISLPCSSYKNDPKGLQIP